MASCQSDYVTVCKTVERGLTPLLASIFLMYVMTILFIILFGLLLIFLIWKYHFVRCKVCGEKMKLTVVDETTNVWECPRCGHKDVYEDIPE